MNLIFEQYNLHATYVSYLVTSTQHCYLKKDIFFTADTTGTEVFDLILYLLMLSTVLILQPPLLLAVIVQRMPKPC